MKSWTLYVYYTEHMPLCQRQLRFMPFLKIDSKSAANGGIMDNSEHGIPHPEVV